MCGIQLGNIKYGKEVSVLLISEDDAKFITTTADLIEAAREKINSDNRDKREYLWQKAGHVHPQTI